MSQSNLKHRTPFLDVSSFAADETETAGHEETTFASTDYEVDTPFRSVKNKGSCKEICCPGWREVMNS